MAKASPLIRGFTAGEFSPFMEGRTDIEPFALSLREAENFLAAPQGPLVRRSGTRFYAPAHSQTAPAKLLSFSFNEEQSYTLEISPTGRVRFFNDDGLIAAPAVAVTSADTVNSTIAAAGLAGAVGDQIFLRGFVPSANVNDQPTKITAVTGSVYTVDLLPVGFQAGATASKIYHVQTDLTAAAVASLRFVASLDTIYLLSPQMAPRRLTRQGAMTWVFDTPGFTNFPFDATIGWPTAGAFFGDRLWFAGAATQPDGVAGSKVGDYSNFTVGTLDDAAIKVRLNARRLGQVGWMRSDARGLLIGTGAGVWSLAPAEGAGSAITPTNIEAKLQNARGVALVDCVQVDDDLLFVQRARRQTRALQYVGSDSGYKAKSLSIFASHIGALHSFAQIEYAEEPSSIVWHRCDDGTLAGLTYDKEQQVGGWHRHTLKDAKVEAIAVIPSAAAVQDALWLQTVRTINGQTRRYIEKLTPIWDFDADLENAWYVDCGLSYEGSPISDVYGLWFLEGQTIFGLADGSPIAPLVVANGAIRLPAPASRLVLGVGLRARAKTQRIEAGAADGTAQGKKKRISKVTARFYKSGGGRIGRLKTADLPEKFEQLEFRRSEQALGRPVQLFSGDKTLEFPPGYDTEGTMVIEALEEAPLPLNVVALMPQVTTEDAR